MPESYLLCIRKRKSEECVSFKWKHNKQSIEAMIEFSEIPERNVNMKYVLIWLQMMVKLFHFEGCFSLCSNKRVELETNGFWSA